MAILTVPEVQAIQAEIVNIRSKRMRLLRSMQLLLQTITKSRGYNTDIVEVSFDVKSWRDKSGPQTPVAYIIDDTTILRKHAGCIREYEWTLRIFGVVREKTIQEFEEFISDIEEAIYDNNTLFGEANLMWIPEITTDNQLFSGLDGTHLFEAATSVAFTRRYNRPK